MLYEVIYQYGNCTGCTYKYLTIILLSHFDCCFQLFNGGVGGDNMVAFDDDVKITMCCYWNKTVAAAAVSCRTSQYYLEAESQQYSGTQNNAVR